MIVLVGVEALMMVVALTDITLVVVVVEEHHINVLIVVWGIHVKFVGVCMGNLLKMLIP